MPFNKHAGFPDLLHLITMTAIQILEQGTRPSFSSRKAFTAHVRRQIIKAGFTPVKATEDDAGNCTICGESGRCPGWHTTSEIKPA